jgi:hypothetical protein
MNKKQFGLILACTIIFAFLGGMAAQWFFSSPPVLAEEQEASETEGEQRTDIDGFLLKNNLFIGVVEKGKFNLWAPSQPLAVSVRLTGIRMQEARPPETGELNLDQYEGKAVMVSGHDGGGWIYRAAIVDSGGPLVTALVQEVFGHPR